ncbi:unnamed protein product [Lampetra fluviatilis]
MIYVTAFASDRERIFLGARLAKQAGAPGPSEDDKAYTSVRRGIADFAEAKVKNRLIVFSARHSTRSSLRRHYRSASSEWFSRTEWATRAVDERWREIVGVRQGALDNGAGLRNRVVCIVHTCLGPSAHTTRAYVMLGIDLAKAASRPETATAFSVTSTRPNVVPSSFSSVADAVGTL